MLIVVPVWTQATIRTASLEQLSPSCVRRTVCL